jgi:hypothetical protein
VLAFAFASMPEVVEKVAVGVKSKEEVRMNHEMIQAALLVNPDVWHEAKWRGLLPKDIPIPKRKGWRRTSSLRRLLSVPPSAVLSGGRRLMRTFSGVSV